MYLIRYFLKTLRRFSNMLGWLLSGRFDRIHEAFRDLYRRRYAHTRRLIHGVVHRLPLYTERSRRASLMRLLVEWYGYDPQVRSKKVHIAIIARDAIASPRSSLFIRLIGPLTQSSIRNVVFFKLYPENTTHFPDDIDICIVQRTAFDDEKLARLLAENLRNANVRLIVDSDDAFNFIQQHHPEYQAQLQRVAALNYLTAEADQIWLSVPALAAGCHPHQGSIEIIPNSLDERIWRSTSNNKPKGSLANKPIQLLYMGTVSHDEDFEMILSALDKVAAAQPGSFELTVIGAVKELPERSWIKRLEQAKTIYPLFVKWFVKQGPFDVGLSPLIESSFNQAKSDIKCLDYLAAGILPLVSDLLPYQSPELDGYITRVKNDPSAWEKKLLEIVSDPRCFRRQKRDIIPKAQTYIWQSRSSAASAEQIGALLNKL